METLLIKMLIGLFAFLGGLAVAFGIWTAKALLQIQITLAQIVERNNTRDKKVDVIEKRLDKQRLDIESIRKKIKL